MNSGVILNAYPDSMGGTLSSVITVLKRPEFKDVFRSFYILPSLFNTDLDRGFSIISYDLNRRLACRDDINALHAMRMDLMLDFVLNHLSVLSPQFQDILQKGDASAYRDFFIDWNQFWEGRGELTVEGYIQPDPEQIEHMFFRKPGLPFLMVRFPDGRSVPYWNTFYQEVRYDPMDAQDLMHSIDIQYGEACVLATHINTSLRAGLRPTDISFAGFEPFQKDAVALLEERRKYLGQMDLNLRSDLVWQYYEETLARLADYGAAIVRLDAFAYAPKAPGSRNFFNEPDTWTVLEKIAQLAAKYDLTLVPEIHASYAEGRYRQLSAKHYMVYDFSLPGLVIDAIENHDPYTLLRWAQEQKEGQIRTINMLGCHDGIPLLDLEGLLPDERIQSLIDLVVSRGGLIKNLHGQKNVYYQVNATFYSALGADDRKMVLARALQIFMPGKPQVWYLDLFAGKNDLDAVYRGGAASHKEINRTNLTCDQLEAALRRSVVKDQLTLLRIRNKCPAFDFDAELKLEIPAADCLIMIWKKEDATARLEANLSTYHFSMTADWKGEHVFFSPSVIEKS